MTFTPFLPSMPLIEPIIASMIQVMKTQLPGVITLANSNIADGFPVPTVAQYLDYFPSPVELQGGTPIIAVGEVPPGGQFENDQQSFSDARYSYRVAAIHQEADNETLVKNLRRLQVCMAYAIQLDRVAAGGGVMRNTGGVWSVNFVQAEPGEMIALEPNASPGSPRVWLSWTSLLLSSTHEEV